MKLQSAIGLSTLLIPLSLWANGDTVDLYCFEKTGEDKQPLRVEMFVDDSAGTSQQLRVGGCLHTNTVFPEDLEKMITCSTGDGGVTHTTYKVNRKTGIMEVWIARGGEQSETTTKFYDCENSDNMPNKF